MQIKVYSGFSKENNSTKQPTGGTTVNCVLKENTSLVNPIFILNGASFSTNYVEWNGRYYFVDDVVSIRNDAVELHCSVDALASWKTSIGSSSQYVTRAAGAYDPYCVDGLYPTENRASVSYTYMSGLKTSGNIDLIGTGSYVVGVVSGEGQGVTYYNMTASDFSTFMAYMFGGNWLDAPLTELSIELQKELINPFQYIVSINWFPFTLGGTSQEMKFGWWDNTGLYRDVIEDSARYQVFSTSITIPRHNQAATRGSYLNGSPFTRHQANFYVWGSFPIDAMYFIESGTCALSVGIDMFTGVGVLHVSDPSGNTIYKASAQCGVPIQVSQVTQNIMGAALSGIASAVSFAAGNPMGVASGIISSIQNLMPQLQTTGAQGSVAGWKASPTLVSTFYQLVSEDNTHLGRPLMMQKTISTLAGFIQVENPDVDIPATQSERDAIISYMQSGFYYE